MTDNIREVSKLNKLEDYHGLVCSITGDEKLITKDELRKQMLEAFNTASAAPITVWTETGKCLDATALYIECARKAVVKPYYQTGGVRND